jgi:hypothetical protein
MSIGILYRSHQDTSPSPNISALNGKISQQKIFGYKLQCSQHRTVLALRRGNDL